jgi:hypothetical protein
VDVNDHDELRAQLDAAVKEDNARNLAEFVSATRELRAKISDSLLRPKEEWLEDHGIVGWAADEENSNDN